MGPKCILYFMLNLLDVNRKNKLNAHLCKYEEMKNGSSYGKGSLRAENYNEKVVFVLGFGV
jgi:hypothetical protein